VLQAQGEGVVNTVGNVANNPRDKLGNVLNNDGTISAVIHQYDRNQDLLRSQELRQTDRPSRRDRERSVWDSKIRICSCQEPVFAPIWNAGTEVSKVWPEYRQYYQH
jgi:hypothetical protein